MAESTGFTASGTACNTAAGAACNTAAEAACNPADGFADVVVRMEPEITVSYRCDKFVAEEGLRDGIWVTLSYNAAGYLMAANDLGPPYMETDAFAAPQSFALNVDGQELCSDWEWGGIEICEGDGECASGGATGTCASATGGAAAGGGRTVKACVTLVSAVRPVKLRIYTVLDGTGVMERSIEVENTGERSAAIASISPMAGGLQQISMGRNQIFPDGGMYRLGYMKSSKWGGEGSFGWISLPEDGFAIYGRNRRDRHRHPMFLLENRLTGETFIAQFAWSGGYAFEFDLNFENFSKAALSMNMRIDAPGPLLVLPPGGKYKSPSVHFGMVFGGLDPAIQAMHSHVRRSVFLPYTRGISGWIESAIGPEYTMDIDNTLATAEYAHSIGAEVFFIDAGWYAGPGQEGEWWGMCGDWRYNKERYPGGISQVRDFVHQRGMLFGLWMDAERIGPKSGCWSEHGGWIAKNYKGKPNSAGLLNLADPEVAAWMEEQIVYLIEEYKIDFFRLDYNVGSADAICRNEREGYLENSFARYYENVYGMYKRLREKYPGVIFENCAGGGGRTDLGMTAGFTHTWVTDWQVHPNAFRITNGMTMALPPECVDRLIGGQAAYVTADLDFQLRNLMFARPTIGRICPAYAKENPAQIAAIKKYVKLYKEFVRPMHANSKIYHHTPELASGFGGWRQDAQGGSAHPHATGSPHRHAAGFGILELDAGDASRGMLGVFRLAEPEMDEVKVKLKGIDAGRTYEVIFSNSGARAVVSGYELAQYGIAVNLGGSLTSELVLYKATDASAGTGICASASACE